MDAEQNRYAVEHLLDRRIRRLRGRNRQVIQYLVRWEGYGPNDDQWVDEGDIDDGLIQAYATSTKSA
jgi:Chromo (CHRromatin Organisation MOdifier) domain